MKISEIKERIAMWEAAEAAVMANKSYTVDGLSVTRQDAQVIAAQISYWKQRLAIIYRGGCFGRRQVRPLDKGC
jgi:hypothetical protein